MSAVMPIERGMHRDRKLLDLCHDAPCMLRVDKVCRSGINPSVPAHSNLQRHGRGHSHKSHDCYAVPGCIECHAWLDTGPASREAKEFAFMAALERWLLYLWRNGLVKVA